MAKPKDLIGKNVKGRIKILSLMPYHGCPILVQRVDDDLFQYITNVAGSFYQGYIVMKPKSGKSSLSKEDVNNTMQMALAGAYTTIETLLGIKDEKSIVIAEEVAKVGGEYFGKVVN
jgi:hypothetical protein